MLLKECAKVLELAESTISRAVSNKYLACPQGLFALRYFFTQSAVDDGSEEGISASAIKSVIMQLIEHEDKTQPYTDSMLHDRLHQQGIKIARKNRCKIPRTTRYSNCSTTQNNCRYLIFCLLGSIS